MNERLYYHYDKELQHLRETAADFASQFPDAAEKIGIDPHAQGVCPDPFVERLMEGIAYLTARVQLKMEAEFPRFVEGILETVAPHFLAPIPSMLIAQIQPDADAGLVTGVCIPKNTVIRNRHGRGTTTECEFSIAQETWLWPVRLTDAAYNSRELLQFGLSDDSKAVLQLKFELTAGVNSKALEMNCLPIFINADENLGLNTYETIFSKLQKVVIATGKGKERKQVELPATSVRPMGFEPSEAMLPARDQTFEGYRLLMEYFHFSKRFMFFELGKLREALQSFACTQFEVLLVFKASNSMLDGRLTKANFQLFAVPAVNLVERRLDRVVVKPDQHEYEVIADHWHPLDYEIHTLVRVEGIGENQEDTQTYRPFYSNFDHDYVSETYYTVHRVPRTLREREMQQHPPEYRGSEAYISIVNGNQSPVSPKLEQLSISALCTNRHLPMLMQRGVRNQITKEIEPDFDFRDIGTATNGVFCLIPPVKPRPPLMWVVKNDQKEGEGVLVWRMLSHLSLNYLSIHDEDGKSAASAMKELLGIYFESNNAAVKKLVDSLESVVVDKDPVYERVDVPGPIAFARGIRVTLQFREEDSASAGTFLLASILERFLAKYVSINSFVETILKRSDVMVHRWKGNPGSGRRPLF